MVVMAALSEQAGMPILAENGRYVDIKALVGTNDEVRRQPMQSVLDRNLTAEAIFVNGDLTFMFVHGYQTSGQNRCLVYRPGQFGQLNTQQPSSTESSAGAPPCSFSLTLAFTSPMKKGVLDSNWFSAEPDEWRQIARGFWGAADSMLRQTKKYHIGRYLASYHDDGRSRLKLVPATLSEPRVPPKTWMYFVGRKRAADVMYDLEEDENAFEAYMQRVAHQSTWMETLAMSLLGTHLEALRTGKVVGLLVRFAKGLIKLGGSERLEALLVAVRRLQDVSERMVWDWHVSPKTGPPEGLRAQRYDCMASGVKAYLDAVDCLMRVHDKDCAMVHHDLFQTCAGGGRGCPMPMVPEKRDQATGLGPGMGLTIGAMEAPTTAQIYRSEALEHLVSHVPKDELLLWLKPVTTCKIDSSLQMKYLHNRLVHLMGRKWRKGNKAVSMFVTRVESFMLAYFRLALPKVQYPPAPDVFSNDGPRAIGFWNFFASHTWLLATWLSLYGLSSFDTTAQRLLDMTDGYTYTAEVATFFTQWRDVLREKGLDAWVYSGLVQQAEYSSPRFHASPNLVAMVQTVCGVAIGRMPPRPTPELMDLLKTRVEADYSTLERAVASDAIHQKGVMLAVQFWSWGDETLRAWIDDIVTQLGVTSLSDEVCKSRTLQGATLDPGSHRQAAMFDGWLPASHYRRNYTPSDWYSGVPHGCEWRSPDAAPGPTRRARPVGHVSKARLLKRSRNAPLGRSTSINGDDEEAWRDGGSVQHSDLDIS